MSKASSNNSRSTATRKADDAGYASLSKRPLHVLVFLLPLIVLYELGSIFYLSEGGKIVETISAYRLLSQFMSTLGAPGLYLPGAAIVAVMLVWHVLERHRWQIKPGVVLGMALESALWVLPLLVFAVLWQRHAPVAADTQAIVPLADHPWQARLTLAVGAGLYEELLFRLVLITGVHFIVADLMRLPSSTAYVVAAIASALSFALYHDVRLPTGGVDLRLLGFLAIAGLYFAFLFVLRGFGLAVGTHALYDVMALIVLHAGTP
ncbi:MAG: CPBP family intramembrane glutamic endopeptidase [Planctomycetota bacterium]|nr:CPBP family intramembrane glutamic endopeptidase [Planctomycetota bacterium]